jgi:hypothetical protein
MCEHVRFVDNYQITVDPDPQTERNIRSDERREVIAAVKAIATSPELLRDQGSALDRELLLQRLARLEQ